MTRYEKLNEIRREAYNIQMDIASDIERFGNKAEAQKCRDEAFMGVIRPEWWNSRLDVLFKFDINDI